MDQSKLPEAPSFRGYEIRKGEILGVFQLINIATEDVIFHNVDLTLVQQERRRLEGEKINILLGLNGGDLKNIFSSN